MTVNMVTSGENESKALVEIAKARGLHAYYSDNVVAIECPGTTKAQAKAKAKACAEGTSATVAYVYE